MFSKRLSGYKEGGAVFKCKNAWNIWVNAEATRGKSTVQK